MNLPESTPSTSRIYYAINEQADATKTLYEGTPVTLVGSSASQKIALHAVVVDEFGNVGVENSVEYTHETAVYKKVTSQEEIVDGGEYLVVYEETSKAMGKYGQVKSNYVMHAVDVLIDEDSDAGIKKIITSQDISVKFEQQDNYFYLKSSEGYISWKSAVNFNQPTSSKNGKYLWSITMNSDNSVSIEETIERKRTIKYGSTDFRVYTSSGGNPVQLYKKVTVPSSVTLRAKGDDSNYYATFSSTEDVVFDNDVTVSTVSVANGALQVKPLEKGTYSVSSLDRMQVEDGYYVPANTGVLLTTPVTSTTCYAPLAKQNVTVDDTNLLVAVSKDGVFTGEDGYKYYKLAYDNSTNRTGLGFFWGAANGAPFKVVAGLAYLAVPYAVAASVKSGLQFPDPAGVVVVKASETDGKIYTLSGQQIDKIKGRGVYIINGKKVVRR